MLLNIDAIKKMPPGASSPIRVVLVDDHEMIRRGLALFLSAFDDLKLVGEASNGVEALHLCAEAPPDVVLMDLVMPEMDGVAATAAIHQRYPDIKIIALTSFRDEALVQGALLAGASNYLFKDVSIDQLAETIREAVNQAS